MEQIAIMLGSLKPAASNSLLKCVDTILRCCHSANCFNAIGQVIYSGPLIGKLLQVVLEGTELSHIIVGYIMILNRLIIYDVDLFANVLISNNPHHFTRFLDMIIDKYDSMGQGKQRKMTGIAIAELLGTGNQMVLAKLEALFVILTSIGVELNGLDKQESLIFTYEPRDEDEDEQSLERIRKDALMKSDVLYHNGSFSAIVR